MSHEAIVVKVFKLLLTLNHGRASYFFKGDARQTSFFQFVFINFFLNENLIDKFFKKQSMYLKTLIFIIEIAIIY